MEAFVSCCDELMWRVMMCTDLCVEAEMMRSGGGTRPRERSQLVGHLVVVILLARDKGEGVGGHGEAAIPVVVQLDRLPRAGVCVRVC
jgi:hypothetical protein